jgi:hypothetical protein
LKSRTQRFFMIVLRRLTQSIGKASASLHLN